MILYEPKNPWSTIAWMRGSVLPLCVGPATLCALIAAVGVYGKLTYGINVDRTAHSIVGTSLGFLLVFRSTLANGRFWDGRSAMGGLVQGSRRLIIHLHAYVPEDMGGDEARHRDDILRLLNCYFFSCVMHLRRCNQLGPHSRLRDWLTADEFKAWEGASVRPFWILSAIEDRLGQMATDEERVRQAYLKIMSRDVESLLGAWMSADKVRGTPIPFPYYQLCNFLIIFFTTTIGLVIASYNTSYMTAPPFTFFVVLSFFAMNRMGNELQDPFGCDENDLPLETFGRGLESNMFMLFSTFKEHFSRYSLWPQNLMIPENGIWPKEPSQQPEEQKQDLKAIYKSAVNRVIVTNQLARMPSQSAAADFIEKTEKMRQMAATPTSPATSTARDGLGRVRFFEKSCQDKEDGDRARAGESPRGALASGGSEPMWEVSGSRPSTTNTFKRLRFDLTGQQEEMQAFGVSAKEALQSLVDTAARTEEIVASTESTLTSLTAPLGELPSALSSLAVALQRRSEVPAVARNDGEEELPLMDDQSVPEDLRQSPILHSSEPLQQAW